MIKKEAIASVYQEIQDEICQALEEADGGARFEEELWSREGGGGGRTRIIQHGNVIERGGVNFSAVHGQLPEKIKKAFQVDEDQFFAAGVSIVIHPINPWMPIIHMNIRYFELNDETRWFGGGIDLTPHYIIAEDAAFFHQRLKDVCDGADPAFYPWFKKWADDYFYIKHRKETRGIGGIFYDKLKPQNTGLGYDELFEFSVSIGKAFAPIYVELMHRNRHKAYDESNKLWQSLRRSRYVEFNLVYDSGTKFGLETDGRIESILMSMPPQASWIYDYKPLAGSPEQMTQQKLVKELDWLIESTLT